jgi:hypothetical protein
MTGVSKFRGVDLLIVELVSIWNNRAYVQTLTMKPSSRCCLFHVRNADTCCLKFTVHVQVIEWTGMRASEDWAPQEEGLHYALTRGRRFRPASRHGMFPAPVHRSPGLRL